MISDFFLPLFMLMSVGYAFLMGYRFSEKSSPVHTEAADLLAELTKTVKLVNDELRDKS